MEEVSSSFSSLSPQPVSARLLTASVKISDSAAENGQSCNDRVFLDGQVHDPDRIDFLHRYLLELHKAIQEGVPIRGYLQWSFLDNFEWSQGYSERFGIIYVDYATLQRIPKDSARWYRDVIVSNGALLFAEA